jgi:Domain of Unknown Function (DUF928)
MTDLLRSRTQHYLLTASLMLGISLWFAPVAVAKYRPPKKISAPTGTGTNTTRGDSCNALATNANRNTNVGLTPLAPISHVGQTSFLRPTFVWFVPDRQPYLLQFRLYKADGQMLYRTQMQSQMGIMQFSLPQNQPFLLVGQTYDWQIVLVCNANAPSMNVVTTAKIAVVQANSALPTQLAAAQNPQQRIDLYADAGLWYDALAEARKNPQNPSATTDLLNSLASSEAAILKDWSDRLRQIQSIEQQRPR